MLVCTAPIISSVFKLNRPDTQYNMLQRECLIKKKLSITHAARRLVRGGTDYLSGSI